MKANLKAHCGCRWSIETNDVISAHDVIHEAEAHAQERGHSVLIEGIVRMPKRPWRTNVLPVERKPQRDYQHQP